MLEDNIMDDYQLSREQKEELDRRYSDHQNGIGRTLTWDETVAMTKQELVKRKVWNL